MESTRVTVMTGDLPCHISSHVQEICGGEFKTIGRPRYRSSRPLYRNIGLLKKHIEKSAFISFPDEGEIVTSQTWLDISNLLHGIQMQDCSAVFVDNIERMTHPRVHRSLVPILRELTPAEHLVVTTNSPLVISSVDPTDIVFFEAPFTPITIVDEDPGDGRGRSPHVFTKGRTPNSILKELYEISPSSSDVIELIALIEENIDIRSHESLAEASKILDNLSSQVGPLDVETLRLGFELDRAVIRLGRSCQ